MQEAKSDAILTEAFLSWSFKCNCLWTERNENHQKHSWNWKGKAENPLAVTDVAGSFQQCVHKRSAFSVAMCDVLSRIAAHAVLSSNEDTTHSCFAGKQLEGPMWPVRSLHTAFTLGI